MLFNWGKMQYGTVLIILANILIKQFVYQISIDKSQKTQKKKNCNNIYNPIICFKIDLKIQLKNRD